MNQNLNELEKILSVIATPVALVDQATERILFLNHAAEVLIGYEHEQDVLTFRQLFSERSLKVVAALLELAKNLESGFSIRENEIEVRRKTGRLCHINLSASQMLWDGKNHLVVTMEDLTEVKKSEKERQALMEKSAHDSKLVDIGRLAAGMAHELNNPLAILLGYAENIEAWAESGGEDRAELKKSVIPMHKAALRMSKIVSKMMANIRDQKAKMEVHSLEKVARETLIILEDIIASQSVELVMETEEVYANCDSSQIEQIITNMIMNALHALGHRKEGRQIRIKSYVKGPMHVLEVWNNGSPIPKDIQAQIFTPFFTTKNTGEGTGLGLYMSFNIMKAHSGVLSFKSDEEGTAFYLSFPRVEKPTQPSRGSQLQLLLVDEDVFFRKSIMQKMMGLDVACTEVSEAEDAFAMLIQAKDAFDLVLYGEEAAQSAGVDFILRLQSKCPKTYFSPIKKPISTQEIGDLVTKLREQVLAQKKTG